MADDPRKARKPRAQATTTPAKKVVDTANYVPIEMQLPELPSGGTLATWKSDLTRVRKVSVSGDNGQNWITIHGEGAVGIPPDQLRCILFVLLSRTSGPTSDRGMAYRLWVTENSEMLRKAFIRYTIVCEFHGKTLIPGVEFTLAEAIDMSIAENKFLARSREKYPVRQRATTLRVPTDVKYEVVL